MQISGKKDRGGQEDPGKTRYHSTNHALLSHLLVIKEVVPCHIASWEEQPPRAVGQFCRVLGKILRQAPPYPYAPL
jgi:hypothetical protein